MCFPRSCQDYASAHQYPALMHRQVPQKGRARAASTGGLQDLLLGIVGDLTPVGETSPLYLEGFVELCMVIFCTPRLFEG